MEEKPPEERHNFITGEEDFNKRSGNAEKYAAITTGLIIITHYLWQINKLLKLSDYFIERLEALFKDVLEKVYGLKEVIIRFEFQHRYLLHFKNI